jgi:hypothetical protein
MAKVNLPIVCKKSKDCPVGNICENDKCRSDKRLKDIEYYIEKCKSKGIPITFERGEMKDKIKPVAALKRCLNQKKRLFKLPSKAKSM